MKFILTTLILTNLVLGQVENSKGSGPYSDSPIFHLDIANYESSTAGLTKTDIFLQMPYASIQFVKSDNEYTGKYSVTLSFLDQEVDKIITEKVWTEKISVNDFYQTSSKSNFNISYKTFLLSPGIYHIKCMVEDLDSRKTFLFEGDTQIPNYDDEIALSDIILVSDKIIDSDGEKLIPNISLVITSKDEELNFFYEIYSTTEREVIIEYIIEDKNRGVALHKFDNMSLKAGKKIINETLDITQITLGEFDLVIELKNENNELLSENRKRFYSKLFGFPSTILDLEIAIDQMMYIASIGEIDEIKKSATFTEKLEKFKNYWNAKDPSPNTDENEILSEYFRRVEYANYHFDSYYPGWRTDMGMVYITLGPPNQVERHPFEIDRNPYEVWDYFDFNKRFIFVDQSGFGDYRLTNPDFGEWYRYRN